MACFARHEETDKSLGRPLCLDCYDYAGQVVWYNRAGELWRRTRIAIDRFLQRCARGRGIDPDAIRTPYGKAAEFQRRGVIHFHAIFRLDGRDPDQPRAVLPCPGGLNADDLKDAIHHAARTTRFRIDPHPTRPEGWVIAWGEQLKIEVITVNVNAEITDGWAARYIAKGDRLRCGRHLCRHPDRGSRYDQQLSSRKIAA
jgi:hypothetical protein